MKIPHRELSTHTLQAIIEEFVSREGTEYGSREYRLDEKVGQVLLQLERGEAQIEYDPASQTCHVKPLAPDSRKPDEE